jgi:hypothetical protein
MAAFSRALLPLCACFRGEIPHRADWKAVIGLANHTLTTPSLIDFVDSHRNSIPEDVAVCVRELSDRNAIRNDRLTAQLEEAVAVLNAVGIIPFLVKGAAQLATKTPARPVRKLMSDLDLVIQPGETEAAIKGLATIGYHVDYESDGKTTKWYADLKRPQDVGMIDLHQAIPGYNFFSYAPEDIERHSRMVNFGNAKALVPSPELQALVLMVHDQFQDYDYWTGSIDLRHLLDLRQLIAFPMGAGWDSLMAMAAGTVARNAIETQLLLLTRLLDVRWPAHYPPRLVPRLQVWRQLLQARMPALRYFLLPMGLLDYRGHRMAAEARSSAEARPVQHSGRRWFPKLDSLFFLISLSRRFRAGKI